MSLKEVEYEVFGCPISMEDPFEHMEYLRQLKEETQGYMSKLKSEVHALERRMTEAEDACKTVIQLRSRQQSYRFPDVKETDYPWYPEHKKMLALVAMSPSLQTRFYVNMKKAQNALYALTHVADWTQISKCLKLDLPKRTPSN